LERSAAEEGRVRNSGGKTTSPCDSFLWKKSERRTITEGANAQRKKLA
jgi:hypothetical protein